MLFGPDPNQVFFEILSILSIHCFQHACVAILGLFSCPVEKVFVHTSHMMSHHTCFRALDLYLFVGYVSL